MLSWLLFLIKSCYTCILQHTHILKTFAFSNISAFSSWRRFCAFEGWKMHLFSDFSAKPTLKGWNRCRMLYRCSVATSTSLISKSGRNINWWFPTHPKNTSPQHFTTALRHNTPSQHSFSTTAYYEVLQSNTPTVRPPKRRQNDVHPVLLRTTKYYHVLQNDHPVLLRATKYDKIPLRPQKEAHPVLLRTTKYYRSFQNLNF